MQVASRVDINQTAVAEPDAVDLSTFDPFPSKEEAPLPLVSAATQPSQHTCDVAGVQ